MGEMVERVARAIWQESVGPAHWPEWDTWAPDAWGKVRSRAQARAALVALREPTEAMLAAARGTGIHPADDLYYTAMIDAALEDQTR